LFQEENMPLIKPYRNVWPTLAQGALIAENATLIGDVEIGEDSSIWYGAILRGDVGKIRIGKRSNVQDLACIHMTKRLSDAILGDAVTVGHAAIIHGAIVEDLCLIGMGAVLLDNARIGEGSIVGAGALVTGGAKIPPRSLVLGRPGKVVRQLSEADVAELLHSSERYVRLSRENFGPPGPPLDSSPLASD
jgi:gamma-carbonic anhydrase